MSKAFEFAIEDDVDREAMIERARTEARSAGIVIQGDTAAGRFTGTAEGTYIINGSTLTVEVTGKPAFVPWPMIESALRKVFV